MAKLLSQITPLAIYGPDVEITGLSHDSRTVKTGDLYLAIKGAANDGHAFINEALQKGAAAIAVQAPEYVSNKSSFVVDAKLDVNQGVLAREFYNNPSEKLCITAITGTNGKTSVCQLAASLLTKLSGAYCSKIGTLGIETEAGFTPNPNTTPSALVLQKLCAKQLAHASKFMVLEASSHALVQGRLNGLTLKTAVFTNLSHDHLDYHGDVASYFAAKRSLFTHKGLQHAILPIDQPEAVEILATLDGNVSVLSYSTKDTNATLFLDSKNTSNECTTLGFIYQGKAYTVQTSLLGSFNITNLAQAILVSLAEGFAAKDVFAKASELEGIAGRMQRIANDKSITAVVDYAHTPDALEKALIALRPYAKRLVCVFGCGGDRDKAKRPIMAKIAEAYADKVFITADNPRSESLAAIQGDIVKGFANKAFTQIDDRKQAIIEAVAFAKAGDVVLVAGKGHEKTQTFADETIAFDDAQVLSQALHGGSL